MFYRKKGFTLLELMIVVIIIGILASLAMPRFISAANKAREAEAKNMLGAIRTSQLRYDLEFTGYHVDADLSNGSALDIEMGTSNYYTYSSNDGATSDIVGTATADLSGLYAYTITYDGDIVQGAKLP